MRYTELRRLIFKEPFKPVRLTVDSGESIVVRHPEDIMVNPYCVIVYHKKIFFQTEPEKVASVTTLRSSNGNGSRS